MKRLTKYVAMLGAAMAISAAQPASAKDMWFNLKLGPSFGVNDSSVTQFALQLEFGYQVIPNGHLVFPFQMQMGNSVFGLGIPVGFQYDIPIGGVKGLFIYPRLVLGYAVFIPSGEATSTQHVFLLAPGFGIKYVLKDQFQFGFEPFELPIGIGSATGVSYRLNFYAGIKF